MPGVLSYYVRVRPDDELINLTKIYLEKPLLHEQFVWLIRSLLKVSPKDAFCVSKAKSWLDTNIVYSERGARASLTNEGKVLSALLDAQSDEYVVEKSEMWLAKNPATENERVVAKIREKLAKRG